MLTMCLSDFPLHCYLHFTFSVVVITLRIQKRLQTVPLSPLARGPLRCGAQFDKIGQIGLKPALKTGTMVYPSALMEVAQNSLIVYKHPFSSGLALHVFYSVWCFLPILDPERL